ncbi:hypothetical protein SNEBB_007756 [Seison nebaliae]|nr:hypothetical protein SNEBB_007756 [Seison nebaliae]
MSQKFNSLLAGGEDVGAIVVSINQTSLRCGYSGDDLPKVDLPTEYGYYPLMDENEKIKRDFGTNITRAVHPKKYEIGKYIEKGEITDWDGLEDAMRYSISFKLGCGHMLEESPLFLVEPPKFSNKDRKKFCAMAYERLKIPAVWFAQSSQMCTFAHGKTTAIIVDCGQTHTTISPIVEGYLMKKSICSSPIGGDYVIQECQKMLQQRKINPIVRQRIRVKECVSMNNAARWKQRENYDVSKSQADLFLNDFYKDFMSHVIQVSDVPLEEEIITHLPRVPFEFPNGYNTDFGEERFRCIEPLFDPSRLGNKQDSCLALSNLIKNCIDQNEPDVRQTLLNNIVVTGGLSLTFGFVDRLTKDLQTNNSKIKIQASNTTTERRYANFTGGSILSSMGTFQQCWITKSDYEENGDLIIERKCRL